MVNRVTTYPHGTTIEVLNVRGHIERRVCTSGGGMCRIARDEYEAENFARIFEEYSSHK